VRKLESITDLSIEERDALSRLPLIIKEIRAGEDIVRYGGRPSHCCLLIEGFIYRYKLIGEGRRQIFSFHTPGDIPDLQSLHLKVLDHSLATLTMAKVALIQHDHLRNLNFRFPGIGNALWRDTLIDGSIFREWMAGIGQRSALSRIAHLFCEIYFRLNAVGLADGHSIPFPVTQEQIGDSLGLSTVHVNRSLQKLRSSGLITLRGGTLAIEDWPGLQKVAEFDPIYLHQEVDARPPGLQ
jgi:CRP-like cAMP-binding protein